MKKLISRPATCVVSSEFGDDFFLCLEAWLSDDHQWPHTVELHEAIDVRFIDVATLEVDEPGMLQGTTAPSGYGIVVRPMEDDDCVGMPGLPDFPCPAVVVSALLAGENMDTHIEALVEDDGFVATLMLVSDVGKWLRYSGSWIKLSDLSLIDGMGTVNVDGGAIDVYDVADRSGNQLPVSSLPGPSKNDVGPYYTEIYTAANAQRTYQDPVTAAMAMIPMTIDTVRDLPRAVEIAMGDQTIRWYVEKRARALDPSYKLPWVDDEAVLPLTDPNTAIQFNTTSDKNLKNSDDE